MGLRCCMPGCDSSGRFGFHRFPRDEESCLKWQHLSKQRNLNTQLLPYSHHRLCKKHFNDEDYNREFRKSRLHKLALPRHFLPADIAIQQEHDYFEWWEQKSNVKTTIVDCYPTEISTEDFFIPDINVYSENTTDSCMDASFATIEDLVEDDDIPFINSKSLKNESTIQDVYIDNIADDWVEDMDTFFDTSEDPSNIPFTTEKARNDSNIQNDNNTQSTSNIQNHSKSCNQCSAIQATQKRIETNLRRQLQYSKSRVKLLQKKLKESENLDDESIIRYLSTKFSKELMTFFKMQLRNAGRKNHGQRYIHEEKCMLLALYKKGPRGYRFLSDLFSLPCVRTLLRHSAQVKFDTGINEKLFKFLKSRVSELSDLDKVCTIAWDEVAITSQLHYSDGKDIIDGFVDLGDVRRPDFATHALAFMVRGVKTAYKQPVAYFITGDLNSFELAEIIRLVIQEVLKTGLRIIGSVCDQNNTMSAGVNKLINSNLNRIKHTGKLLSYEVDGNTIIHCFDPPHILKTLRNNLHSKNLKHYVSEVWQPNAKNEVNVLKEPKIAMWDDVREFYQFNNKNTARLLPKITSEHIDPNKLKMKVSVASQVFSNTFGNIMMFCSKMKQLPRDFSGTAHILLFFNDIFDSMNGGLKFLPGSLRSCINASNKEFFFQFWEYSISMLQKMTFVDKITGEINNGSTVFQKCISTIRGYMELIKICLSLGFEKVPLRQMNQDGLENFFGQVRNDCHNPKAPICSQFRSGFTNIIVSNLTAKHSLKANCEDDKSFLLLKNINVLYEIDSLKSDKNIPDNDHDMTEQTEKNLEPEIEFDETIEQFDLSFAENQALVYESSSVCRKILSTTKCNSCRLTLESYVPLVGHGVLLSCEHPNDRENKIFAYPTLLFTNKFKLLFKLTEMFLPSICHQKNLLQKLLSLLDNIQPDGLGCRDHTSEISQKLKKEIVKLSVQTFTKQFNGILSRKILELPPNSSEIHKKAYVHANKKKGKA